MNIKIREMIAKIKTRIRKERFEIQTFGNEMYFEEINKFLLSKKHSDLEKMFYILLMEQELGQQYYFVIPHEEVLVSNVFDFGIYNEKIEYEIDFAVYSGSVQNPLKIAIECDGLRCHGIKDLEKDRKKDVNLQAAGWIVWRINSRQIHSEIKNFANNKGDERRLNTLLVSKLENLIEGKMNLITPLNYTNPIIKSKLTGFTFGTVKCHHCQHISGNFRIDHEKIITCNKCGKTYKSTGRQITVML